MIERRKVRARRCRRRGYAVILLMYKQDAAVQKTLAAVGRGQEEAEDAGEGAGGSRRRWRRW